jgi:two-component system chemotaxis response regulator CheB
LLIGVSTGGPKTLKTLLRKLPAHFPVPILVAQHMPSRFTGPFSERLNGVCALSVKELVTPTRLLAGTVLIARGDADAVLSRRGPHRVASSVPSDTRLLWHPSVERMVRTALTLYAARDIIAVQLTGMGDDGAESMAQVHRGGGRTVAESEESAVLYGMPRELVERGGASVVLPVDRIADQLLAWTMPSRSRRVAG